MTYEPHDTPVSTPSGPSAGLEGQDATQETQDATDRHERYAFAVMGALDCDPYQNRQNVVVCVNQEHEKAGPWLDGIGCPFAAARARAVIAVADQEHHQRLAEIDAVVQTEWQRRAEAAEARVAELEATVREALSTFAHPTHPGRECRQSGHVPVETLRRWEDALYPPKDTTAP